MNLFILLTTKILPLSKVIDYQAKQQKNHSKVFLDVVDKNFFSAYELVKERTMLSPEALYDLWNSIGYSAKKGLTGDILEFEYGEAVPLNWQLMP